MWSTLLSAILIVNELMASNAGEVMSPATNFDSWIELYNPSEEDVNLNGMYLSNDAENLTLWKMPNGIGIVPARGFKVVWLGSNDIKNNQAPFKLDCDGGTIYLSDKNGRLMTSQDYPEAMSRTSYARKTDGGDEWGWTAMATPGATNASAVFAGDRLPAPVVDQGSQLFKGSLNIKVDIPEGTTLMYTTDGSVPTASTGDETPSWISLIENGTCEGNDATCLVSRDGDAKDDENRIVDGIGYSKSRGIRVHAISNPENDWDAQFFVYTPNVTLHEGDHYRFRMMARADKASHISAQSHTTPHSYIHWSMLDGGFDITTTWQEFSFEGEVTSEQAGSSGLQTIAFNLNENKEDNYFYFDNIVWEVYHDPKGANNASQLSADGQFTISKTTNYVFRLFRDGWLPSVPVTRSYIMTNDTYTVPVVSIVGNEKYFTDPMWGIDVEGKNGITGNGRDRDPANWNQNWDRPVNFSYISPTEGMLFNQDVNISVSGGYTRQIDPRSMKLKSNKIFDGLNSFDYSFFPQKPYLRNKTLLLRNGGNDVWQSHARFMDPALTTIVQRSGIDLDVQSTVQVIEYINGKFRGVVNLREPNNDKFVYANYGYDDEDIDMFENGQFKNGTDEAFKQLCGLAKRINELGVYNEVKALLDIDEFCNYIAAELFLGNDDWPNNNIKAYRSRRDGRYRFILFDLDYAFWPWGTKSSYTQVLDEHKEVDVVSLFLNLLNHDEFRKKFIDTFCIMAGSVFEKQRATAIVDELATAMRPMSELDGYVPDNAANTIKTKLRTQLTTMANLLQKYKPMQLTNVKPISIAFSADTDGANIYLNDLQVPYAAFDGQLFAPAIIEAKAPVGYTFTGWRKSASTSIELIKNGDTWKYYDKGTPASNWYSECFNDSGWSSGQAPLGYKMTGVKTTVSYGSDANRKNPATYFRKTINLDAMPTRSDAFLLNYQVDDGFVVYVNGKEAGRYNMPNGTINFNTFSASYAEDTPLTGTLELSSSLFKSGSNTIAVEIHNNSYTSSDQYWAAELLTSVGSSSNEVVSTDPVINLTAESGKQSLVACFTSLSNEEQAAQGITPIRINEVSAANGIYVNEYFKRNDWVELYNTTSQPIDVEGMYLSDKESKPKKYQITKGGTHAETVIPANGFLIVWCDKLEPKSLLHADFKLAAEGGVVMITAADESWSDILTYPEHLEDQTVGRYPDGAPDVFVMNIPTIAKANITSSYMTFVDQAEPTGIRDLTADTADNASISYRAGSLMIHSTLTDDLQLKVVNLAGQTLMTVPVQLNDNYAEVNIGQLPAGVYIASINDAHGQKASCKFVKNTTLSR